MAEPREETSERAAPTDEVAGLWNMLGDMGEESPAAAATAGWKVEPLPTAAEGGIAAMFAAGFGGDDPGHAPPPPDPNGISPLVPAQLRAADTLESLLAGPPSTSAAADPVGLAGPPSLDTFASDAPALGSQPPAWGPYAGVPAMQSGRARLAEMIEELPNEPIHRLTPDDVHVDRPVVAPAAIWFWGDDDIYPGRTPGAGR